MSGDPVADWWRTSIIDMEPGKIALRGRPIEDSIGSESFPAMIWRLVTGEAIDGARLALFEAALVAAVDHGPQAPSIAAARMAATCGVGLQSAMATGVGMLGDVHGGAGAGALRLYAAALRAGGGRAGARAALDALDGRYAPGFGHRFHPVDPRAPRLLALVDEASQKGAVDGCHAAVARAIGTELEIRKGRRIPMNIDGATAVIFGELGCAPPLARGFFVLSRSVGILAHAWEQTLQGGRNKGPTPPDHRWTYDGDTDITGRTP